MKAVFDSFGRREPVVQLTPDLRQLRWALLQVRPDPHAASEDISR